MEQKKRSVFLYMLLAGMILLGPGGWFGGVVMFIDPSGALMGLPSNLLDGLPINNFILPGLFLVVVMGIAPLVIAYGLWRWQPWAWRGALALSVVLILWIIFQIVLWGFPAAIQILYLLWGGGMLALCLVPAVRAPFQAVP